MISVGEKVADTTDTTVISCPSLFVLERNAPFQLEANGKKGFVFFFLCHPSSWTPVVGYGPHVSISLQRCFERLSS